MAYTYSDWITQTSVSGKLTRLRLHIQEVSDLVTASVGSDGTNYNPNVLNEYLRDLRADERRLANRAGPRVTRSRVRGL